MRETHNLRNLLQVSRGSVNGPGHPEQTVSQRESDRQTGGERRARQGDPGKGEYDIRQEHPYGFPERTALIYADGSASCSAARRATDINGSTVTPITTVRAASAIMGVK